ncbi:Sel1 repeat-containing protein [Gigaspora margarita]|uniref:Sel1 repeat-containing protein n=1 Tax=Gigaspora margarita TaxID=4874 RepID=A0A8H4EJV3_GIGMA|nr:Sel1 repeat-containing protein [Gigaspora margarita]
MYSGLLSKAQLKLWKMTNDKQKHHLRKLADEVKRIHNKKNKRKISISDGETRARENKSSANLQQEYCFAPSFPANSDVFMTSGLETPSQTYNALQQEYCFSSSFPANSDVFMTPSQTYNALQQEYCFDQTNDAISDDTNMSNIPSYNALQQGYRFFDNTNMPIMSNTSIMPNPSNLSIIFPCEEYVSNLSSFHLPIDIEFYTYLGSQGKLAVETNADFINLNPDSNEVAVINDSFIRIKYSEPVVTICSDSRVLNISQKPSNTAYSEAEQLFSKFKEWKNDIDNILYSQNVYGVGPDFQNNYSTPCIACWVAEPLNLSVMKQLSKVFDDKFDVVYYLVDITATTTIKVKHERISKLKWLH